MRLVKRVDPKYPLAAQSRCIEGNVSMLVIVAPNGFVKIVKAVTGPVELQRAAVQAVEQWKYEPYLLNGKPVKWETRANLLFHLPDRQCTPNA
jgi:TonB family protein